MPLHASLSPADLAACLADAGIEVLNDVTVPGRAGRAAAVPARLHPATRARLAARYPKGLFAHQGEAITAGLDGDVCLATSTSSGKSLVFMTLADDLLARSPDARILALYPMKALVEDQAAKWRQHFARTDVQVTFLHGDISVKSRWEQLERARVVLMTPDVLYAWVLSSLRDVRMQRFLQQLGLVVIDEAHAYEGAFGTNAAYVFRRLEAAARPFRVVASTATIADAGQFVQALTGRAVTLVGPEKESSPLPARRFVLGRPRVAPGRQGAGDPAAHLMRLLTSRDHGCVLAFADSRRAVEQVLRNHDALAKLEDLVATDASSEVARRIAGGSLLPYRSGHEDEDRRTIQSALTRGDVRGVVATSALELGIDIGAIDVTVLLNVPKTAKAFRQRIGRACRGAGPETTALCVILDSEGALGAEPGALEAYLARGPEPSRLCLDNRFVMYAQALCAAREARQLGGYDRTAFATLPRASLFGELVDNELDPRRAIEDDLLRLKQEAQDDPHHAFPLRSAGEVELQVTVAGETERFGRLTHSQALREAYPGAIYLHLGQPWRVQRWAWSQRQVVVKPMHTMRHGRTYPVRTDLVFPQPQHGGLLGVRESTSARVFEAVCQVSAQVRGFTLRPAPHAQPEPHAYAPASSWSQAPLTRSFTTTCVVWDSEGGASSEAAAEAIRRAYCARLGVHEQDLGVGTWMLQGWRGDGVERRGVCIYDAVQGSLRLGEQLVPLFEAVLQDAIDAARADEDAKLVTELERLVQQLGALSALVTPPEPSSLLPRLVADDTNPWVQVPPVSTRGALKSPSGQSFKVTVQGYRYTPRGLALIVQRDGVRSQETVLHRDVALEPHTPVDWNADTDEVRALSVEAPAKSAA